jgi:hypothetical protein
MLVAFWLLAVPALAQIPVTAAWEPSGDSTTVGYDVSVGVTPGVPLVTLNVGAATSVTLPFPPGAVYFVSVRGYNASGMRGFGTPELAVDLANAPGAPDSLRASVTGSLASLSWTPPSSGASLPAVGRHLARRLEHPLRGPRRQPPLGERRRAARHLLRTGPGR